MARNTLSKSTFIRGLQCYKSLYLYKKRYFLKNPITAQQKLKFQRGTHIGRIARKLFPGGIDLSPPTPFQYPQAVVKTQEAIEAGKEVIYEAAFQYDSVLVALDILVKENNAWHAYEVKSSVKISNTYLWDAALQYYVIRNAGLDLKTISIIYLDKEYKRTKDVAPNEIFRVQDLTKEISSLQDKLPAIIKEEKEVTLLKHSPDISIGPHCYNPYPCDFTNHCWKKIPKNSVFDIPALELNKAFSLFSKNINNAVDIKDEMLNSPDELIQRDALISGKTHIDKEALNKQLHGGRQAAYLSHLAYQPSLPIHKGAKPLQSIILAAYFKDNEYSKTFIINIDNPDPTDFIEFIREITARNKSIITYQGNLLREYAVFLKNQQPETASLIDEFTAQLLDTDDIFQKNYYFRPQSGSKQSVYNTLIENQLAEASEKNPFDRFTLLSKLIDKDISLQGIGKHKAMLTKQLKAAIVMLEKFRSHLTE